MAGVSCKAGTEAIVGLSNPSYNREGFRILFPGAAASGPSPSNPAFPSPGSLLWGVTFCNILTAGNRRCPQPQKVRVASVPLTARPGITREVGGRPLPSALQAITPPPSWHTQSPPLPPRAPGSLARFAGGRQQENGGGLSLGGRATGDALFKPKDGPDPRHRRQYSPLLVCRGPRFLSGTSGMDEVPFRPRMEADEHEKWFREPPPPSLKSS